ncbi:MAG: DUF4230 domain-containing protein [Clostridia bacterium]|nr:DUF4230 domain-containing protein [Clostridia bacterium]
MKKLLTIFATITLVAVAICGITTYKAKAAMNVADHATDNIRTLGAALVDASASKEIYQITNVEVKHELKAIGVIEAYELEYAGTDEIISSKEKLGLKLPGSEYKITLIYNGVIKAGYDLNQAEITVDNENKKITVKLPEAKILQNDIDLSNLKTIQDTSFMSKLINPIQSDTVTNRLKEIEKQELDTALNRDDILQKAEDNVKDIITGTLSKTNYEVIFEG